MTGIKFTEACFGWLKAKLFHSLRPCLHLVLKCILGDWLSGKWRVLKYKCKDKEITGKWVINAGVCLGDSTPTLKQQRGTIATQLKSFVRVVYYFCFLDSPCLTNVVFVRRQN